MKNTSILKELVLGRDGKYLHIRSGKRVRSFQVKGIGKRNNLISTVLVPMPATLRVFQEMPLLMGVRRIVMDDGEVIVFETKGTPQQVRNFLAKTESLDEEEENETS